MHSALYSTVVSENGSSNFVLVVKIVGFQFTVNKGSSELVHTTADMEATDPYLGWGQFAY